MIITEYMENGSLDSFLRVRRLLPHCQLYFSSINPTFPYKSEKGWEINQWNQSVKYIQSEGADATVLFERS